MMKNKGQTGEIMGLLVLVILLLVLGAIYLNFAMQPKSDIVSSTRSALSSANLLEAIKLYTVCDGVIMEDAIRACASGALVCGKDACELIEDEIKNILNATLTSEMERGHVVLIIEDSDADAEPLLEVGEGLENCNSITFSDRKTINLRPGIVGMRIGRCVS